MQGYPEPPELRGIIPNSFDVRATTEGPPLNQLPCARALTPPPPAHVRADPDNYEVCVLEAYLDLYSLTGNATYLSAVLGGFDMLRDPVEGWLFPGGSFALNENFLYPPGAFPLEFDGRWGAGSRPTGEFCPSAFWIKLNQRLHRLFPAEEAYVGEMERALINVGLAGQAGARGVRYFARLHGEKDAPTVKGTCCEGQSARIFGGAPEFVFSVAPGGALPASRPMAATSSPSRRVRVLSAPSKAPCAR
jgi:hypothetical protein